MGRLVDAGYLSGQATIAAACDFMLPLCPPSVAGPGRKAIAGGIGVDRSLTFWAAVLAKLLVPVGLLVCTSVAMRWGWLRLLEPARARQEEARALVETAQQRAQEAEERAVQAELQRELAEEDLARSQDYLREAQKELMQLDEDIAQAKQTLEQMRGRRNCGDRSPVSDARACTGRGGARRFVGSKALFTPSGFGRSFEHHP